MQLPEKYKENRGVASPVLMEGCTVSAILQTHLTH
jgi:hypothetical protein